MITIIITSYNEPKATLRAVNAFLDQKINEEFEIIVVDPFKEVEKLIKKNIKNKRVKFFLDPGEGKPFAMNLIFKMLSPGNKKDIIDIIMGDKKLTEDEITTMMVDELLNESNG